MVIVNLLGLALIVLIVWWFWLYRPVSAALDDKGLLIIVENGIYQPARISLPANRPSTINFLRKDSSPCAEMLLIPELEISETLPVNKIHPVNLPGLKAGTYAFHCQMQMYRGELHVE